MCAGIDISSEKIRGGLVVTKSGQKTIKKLTGVNIPAGTLAPGFKKDNILDETGFQTYLKQVCWKVPAGTLHVALPDACIKLGIQTYKELPSDHDEIDKLLVWQTAAAFNLPAGQLRVVWRHLGKSVENTHVFLVAMAMEAVIARYETVFSTAGIHPASLVPAGLARFNFYAPPLPRTGCAAFLALFDEFIQLFVFFQGLPLFYRMISKGMLDPESTSAINDVDLLLQYYAGEFPGHPIDKLYVVSQITDRPTMPRILQNLDIAEFTILDETRLIHWDDSLNISADRHPLTRYSAVLGAAVTGRQGQ